MIENRLNTAKMGGHQMIRTICRGCRELTQDWRCPMVMISEIKQHRPVVTAEMMVMSV